MRQKSVNSESPSERIVKNMMTSVNAMPRSRKHACRGSSLTGLPPVLATVLRDGRISGCRRARALLLQIGNDVPSGRRIENFDGHP